mmetsp:Transcript_66338/g.183188  ORF Transcript_66338/g.183188 Transcript_66338/m.183188 type:complete len:116 (-) Transcript_66338:716-1063(-)
MLHHVSKGVYVEQFRRWFSVFPREHFFVESLEAFRQNPVAVYTRVCSFLGVEATGSASFPTDAALENQLARRYNEGTNQVRHMALGSGLFTTTSKAGRYHASCRFTTNPPHEPPN